MFLTGNQGEEYYSEIFLPALTKVGFDNGWKSYWLCAYAGEIYILNMDT